MVVWSESLEVVEVTKNIVEEKLVVLTTNL